MSRDELEAALFREFASQPRWRFEPLYRRLGQPAMTVKAVLNDIGLLNQRGPNAGLWEIRKEFRGAEGGGGDGGGDAGGT